MDTIVTFEDHSISSIIVPTQKAFLPLLAANRSKIESTERKTFRYGEHERHQLDVYCPAASQGEGETKTKVPILFWIYGGGWVKGERANFSSLPGGDLVYKNIGSWFAERGFYVVIPDYRLLPHGAKFPDPIKDVRDAIVWVTQNASGVISSPSRQRPDTSNIFLIGHSAGASSVISLFLLPDMLPLGSPLREQINGIGLLSGSYETKNSPIPRTVHQYYGPADEDLERNSPIGLLRALSARRLAVKIPNVLMSIVEYEPQNLVEGNREFRDSMSKLLGIEAEWRVWKGHNHISLATALGSGSDGGEIFGEEIVDFLRSCLR
ncbi:AB hydrolase superfamily protein [Abortiporus biennis]